MSIQQQLRHELKDAMRSRDQQRLNVLRLVETEISKEKTSADFSGELDDALYLRVIAAYSKRMAKAIKEYEAVGERGQQMAEQLRFEVQYLERWLPSQLDQEATRQLVAQVVQELGADSPRAMGQVMGQIMTTHKGQVDGGLVSRLVKEALGK